LIFRFDLDGDAAAHGELRANPAPARLEGGHQVFKDDIGDVFMKNTLVAERP